MSVRPGQFRDYHRAHLLFAWQTHSPNVVVLVPKLQGRQGNLPENQTQNGLNATASAVVMRDWAWQIAWKLSSRSHLQSHACERLLEFHRYGYPRHSRANDDTQGKKEKNKPVNHTVKTGNALQIFDDAKKAKAE